MATGWRSDPWVLRVLRVLRVVFWSHIHTVKVLSVYWHSHRLCVSQTKFCHGNTQTHTYTNTHKIPALLLRLINIQYSYNKVAVTTEYFFVRTSPCWLCCSWCDPSTCCGFTSCLSGGEWLTLKMNVAPFLLFLPWTPSTLVLTSTIFPSFWSQLCLCLLRIKASCDATGWKETDFFFS